MIRLDIGCGLEVEEGWIGIDPAGEGKDNIIARLAWDLPYDADTVDEIRCHHALEHFDPEMLNEVMWEWRRVLKPGGTVEITVPDAAYVLQYLLDHPKESWAHVMVYGRGLWAGDEHLTAWDAGKLSSLVYLAGFRLIDTTTEWDESHQQNSVRVLAVKP